jgi:hypothetical protein
MDLLLPRFPAERHSPRLPLRIGHFGRRGRGVIADCAIRKGELIERSPVLIIPP